MFLYQSSQSTKVSRRSVGTTNSARTDEVFDHIATAALPANPKALQRIQEILREKDGRAGINRTALIQEIISDPGLGLYYLSNLRSALDLDTLPDDPLLPVHSMSEAQLREFFLVKPGEISKHRISEAGPPQFLRLQHTFIASKSAANLARQFSLEEGKTFSLVHVSQAALNLLAWSYPQQFHKALFNKRKFNASLEESLSSLIGVKTDNIVNKLARKVGLPASLMMDLQMAQRPGVLDPANLPVAPSILTLARLGDLLAKANDKEHYPEALNQWERVERQLEERNLQTPASEIHDSIKEFIDDLGAESALPYHMALFQTQVDKSSSASSKIADPNKLNPYFKRVPEQIRSLIEVVYNNINKGSVSVKALQILIEELVPILGVSSGCLYLVREKKSLLEVTLPFGKVKKSRQNLELHSNDPIAQSLFCNIPQRFDSGHGRVSICGSLPECRKQAVLLMEFDTQAYKALGESSFVIFQAFAAALVDVMDQRITV